jgi:hypothetical protein
MDDMVRAVKKRVVLAAVTIALPLVLGAASYATRARLPLVLRGHFADGAWGFALGAFVALVWLDQKASHRAVWIAAAAAFAAGFECLQYAHIVRGVFDPVDLVVQTSAVVVAANIIGVIGGMKRWTLASEAR